MKEVLGCFGKSPPRLLTSLKLAARSVFVPELSLCRDPHSAVLFAEQFSRTNVLKKLKLQADVREGAWAAANYSQALHSIVPFHRYHFCWSHTGPKVLPSRVPCSQAVQDLQGRWSALWVTLSLFLACKVGAFTLFPLLNRALFSAGGDRHFYSNFIRVKPHNQKRWCLVRSHSLDYVAVCFP